MQLLPNRCALLTSVLISVSYPCGILADGGHNDEELDFHHTTESPTETLLADSQPDILGATITSGAGDLQTASEETEDDDEDKDDDEEDDDDETTIVEGTANTSEESVPEVQASDETTAIQGDTPPPTQELMEIVNPTANLTINPSWVDPGQHITLSWNTEGVTGCSASGNWMGSKTITGSVSVGPIFEDSSYVLDCQGEKGSAIAMVTVRVRTAKLSWSQPTHKSDGSPLLDPVSYRLYVGTQSGIYDAPFNFGTTFSRVIINLLPGHYFFAISSVDSENNESVLSGEVSKIIE